MMKALYFDFIPTKEQEQACAASNEPYEPTRSLVELQDVYEPPCQDPDNPWVIRKCLSGPEVRSGRVVLSHYDMFDHVLRWWDLDTADDVVIKGKRLNVTVRDVSDGKSQLTYCGEKLYVERGPGHEFYSLWGCEELIRGRGCEPGDEVGFYWDEESAVFYFKFLRRGEELLSF